MSSMDMHVVGVPLMDDVVGAGGCDDLDGGAVGYGALGVRGQVPQ